MKVTLLGTGTPAPNPHRAQAAVLVEVDGAPLLFDTGRGVVTQLARAGVNLATIDRVFITHLHCDHVNDLFDVIVTSALAGRDRPLHVYGPVGTTRLVRGLLDVVYDADYRSRRAEYDRCRQLGLDVADPRAIQLVEPHDVRPGSVCDDDGWSVLADEVRHGDLAPDPGFDWRCLGYRIEAGARVVTVSGDTVPCEGIIRLARDADLLVQCSHFAESAISDDLGRHFTKFTLPTAGQAGRIASAAGAAHLVLTHISQHADPDELARDAQRTFDGTVTVGTDLARFEV